MLQRLKQHARIAVLAAMLAFTVAPAAFAQSAGDRPLYLDIVGTQTGQAILPDDLVEAMAREVLSQSGQAVLGVDDGSLPSGVRVLRIMVLVSESQDATGTVIAAAASTSLLHTPGEGPNHTAARSLYQGMQQEMTTGPNEADAENALRARFKAELQKRIRAAMSAGP